MMLAALGTVQALLDARSLIREKIAYVDQALQEARDSLSDLVGGKMSTTLPQREVTPQRESPKPTKKLAIATHTKKLSGQSPRGPVWDILKASGKPLAEDEIAIQLMQNGYKTDLPPEELVVLIYTEALNPLIQSGLVEPVGTPPNRRYRKK